MPKKQRTLLSSHLPLTQLLVMLLFVIAAAIYQYWNQASKPAPALFPTNTPQRIKDGPTGIPMQATLPDVTSIPSSDTTSTATSAAMVSTTDKMGQFDYFVLALSWSPDYCATSGSDDPQECSPGKKLGFVLHGLWPQNEQGYPSNCSIEKLTENVKAQFPGLYPNENLYDHEWEKHGTCAGLTPPGYLTLTRQIKESVIIPNAFRAPQAPFRISANQLKQAFTLVNAGFNETSFEVNCSSSGRYLKELYVCVSRQGEPTACGSDVHKDALKSCQKADFLVRNTR